MNKMSDQYYPIFKLWGFTAALVHTRHPDDFQVIKNNARHLYYYLSYLDAQDIISSLREA